MTPLTQHLVLPSLAIDSQGRLAAAVCSPEIVAVCLKRVSEAVNAEFYTRMLHEESWAALFRHQDNAYFLTVSGLLPTEDSRPPTSPEEMEAVHMAIEIGLATWPEWGDALREKFTPKAPIQLHLAGKLSEIGD